MLYSIISEFEYIWVPGGSEVKASAWNAGDPGSIPGSGIAPGEEKWPLQYSLPGESHGGRSLVGYSTWGRKESETTEQLHFHFLRYNLQCWGGRLFYAHMIWGCIIKYFGSREPTKGKKEGIVEKETSTLKCTLAHDLRNWCLRAYLALGFSGFWYIIFKIQVKGKLDLSFFKVRWNMKLRNSKSRV